MMASCHVGCFNVVVSTGILPAACCAMPKAQCAPGKIATELLFSHRNDAQLVLTGIAKAQPQQRNDAAHSP